MAKLPNASTNPGLQVYQKYLDNEGLRWYTMQHANELKNEYAMKVNLGPMGIPVNTSGGSLANLPLMML